MPLEINNSQTESQVPITDTTSEVAPESDFAAPPSVADNISKMVASLGTDTRIEDSLDAPKDDAPAVSVNKDVAVIADKPVEPVAIDDLTPPENMNPRSQERWQKLTGRVKEAEAIKTEYEAKLSESSAQVDGVRQLVERSSLDAQEFVDVLDLGRIVKSSQPEDLKSALQRLDVIRADVALRLGIDVPQASALDAFPDLKQRVEDMQLTQQDAMEIARLRNANVITQRQQQALSQSSEHERQINGAAQSIVTELEGLSATPGHAIKIAYIEKHFAQPLNQRALVDNFHPNQWARVIRTMYDSYTPPVVAAPAGPQPLRSSAVAQGQLAKTGPTNMNDAVKNAMAHVFAQ